MCIRDSYITGFLILLGVLLGRFICGFLCPFGWLQELLHKIPTKKISTKKLKPLTYIKYAVLLFMVVLMPMLITNDVGIDVYTRQIVTYDEISDRLHRRRITAETVLQGIGVFIFGDVYKRQTHYTLLRKVVCQGASPFGNPRQQNRLNISHFPGA